jgi:hypothetical protein
MSYLDNLENNLKALENLEERDPVKVQRERERREADKQAAVLRAPHAEMLKTSPFTMELLTQCRAIGHGQRMLVRFTWLGETLRLDAQEKRMELAPTSQGIEAVFSLNGEETGRANVDLQADDPAALARRWLVTV